MWKFVQQTRSVLALLAALLLLIQTSQAADQFINPPDSTSQQLPNAPQNWTVGSTHLLKWETDYPRISLLLYHETLNTDHTYSSYRLLNFTSPVTEYNFTLTSDIDISNGSAFHFTIENNTLSYGFSFTSFQTGPINFVPADFSGGAIATGSPALPTSSSTASPSGAAATVAPASESSGGSLSQSAIIGLGVGIGIGIPLLLLIGGLIGFRMRRDSARAQASHTPVELGGTGALATDPQPKKAPYVATGTTPEMSAHPDADEKIAGRQELWSPSSSEMEGNQRNTLRY